LPQDEDAFLDAEGVGDEDDEEEEDDEEDEDEEGASDGEDEDGADLDASALALAAGADRAASAAALVAKAGMQARPGILLGGAGAGRCQPTFDAAEAAGALWCRAAWAVTVSHTLASQRGQLIGTTGPPGGTRALHCFLLECKAVVGAEAPAGGAAGLRRLRTV